MSSWPSVGIFFIGHPSEAWLPLESNCDRKTSIILVVMRWICETLNRSIPGRIQRTLFLLLTQNDRRDNYINTGAVY